MSSVDWDSLNKRVVEVWETSCPFCGRVLLECVSGESKRYCSSCNEEFRVSKVG